MQPIFKTLTMSAVLTKPFIAWQSKCFSNEKIRPHTTMNTRPLKSIQK